jgi:uncharacterized membrane protein
MTTQTDAEMDRTLGLLLRWGVLAATAVVLVGGAVYLYRHGLEERPDFRTFAGEPARYSSIAGVFGEAARGGGRGIVQLGVLLLIATPVARVVFSIYAFGRQRDGVYVGVTVVVLMVLLYGLVA